MKEERNVEKTTNEVGARQASHLVIEATEALKRALAREPWNHEFTEEQKSGLIKFHCTVQKFLVLKATTVWNEGEAPLGEMVFVKPADGALYSVSMEWLGGRWVFLGGPEPLAQVPLGNLLPTWLMDGTMTVCSQMWLCDLNAVFEHLTGEAVESPSMALNVTP